jgi:hypothetical protein
VAGPGGTKSATFLGTVEENTAIPLQLALGSAVRAMEEAVCSDEAARRPLRKARVFAMVILTRGRRSGKRGEVAHELAVDGSPRLGQLEHYYKKAFVEAP